ARYSSEDARTPQEYGSDSKRSYTGQISTKPSTSGSEYWGEGNAMGPTAPSSAPTASRPDTRIWREDVRKQIRFWNPGSNGGEGNGHEESITSGLSSHAQDDLNSAPEDEHVSSLGHHFSEFNSSSWAVGMTKIHPLMPVGELTYRFCHQHLSHTVKVPADVYLMPMLLPSLIPRPLAGLIFTGDLMLKASEDVDATVRSRSGVMFAAPSQRIPELILSNLQVCYAVQNGVLKSKRYAKKDFEDEAKEAEESINLDDLQHRPEDSDKFISSGKSYPSSLLQNPHQNNLAHMEHTEQKETVEETRTGKTRESDREETIDDASSLQQKISESTDAIISKDAYSDILRDIDERHHASEHYGNEASTGANHPARMGSVTVNHGGGGLRPSSASSVMSNRDSFFSQRVSIYAKEHVSVPRNANPAGSRLGGGHRYSTLPGIPSSNSRNNSGGSASVSSRVNGNGVPESVILDLEKSVSYPPLTASMVIRRDHIRNASEVAEVPEADNIRLNAILKRKEEEEKERLIRLEVRAQARALKRGIAARLKREAETQSASDKAPLHAETGVQSIADDPGKRTIPESVSPSRRRSGLSSNAMQGEKTLQDSSLESKSVPKGAKSRQSISENTEQAIVPQALGVGNQGGGVSLVDWFNAASEGAAHRARAKSQMDLSGSRVSPSGSPEGGAPPGTSGQATEATDQSVTAAVDILQERSLKSLGEVLGAQEALEELGARASEKSDGLLVEAGSDQNGAILDVKTQESGEKPVFAGDSASDGKDSERSPIPSMVENELSPDAPRLDAASITAPMEVTDGEYPELPVKTKDPDDTVNSSVDGDPQLAPTVNEEIIESIPEAEVTPVAVFDSSAPGASDIQHEIEEHIEALASSNAQEDKGVLAETVDEEIIGD
ncbi:hypothetical protein HDU96_001710, partial [Phlyctochytrium bullatum]